MRHIIKFVVFFVLFLTATLHAQTVRSFGIKSGLTLANQRSQIYYDKTGNHLGINLGIYSEFEVFGFLNNNYISFISELGYDQKGVIEKIGVTTDSPDIIGYLHYSHRIDYLYVNAVGKIRRDLNRINPYFLVGMRVDFRQSVKHDETYSFDDSIFDNLERINYGLIVGTGTEINNLFIAPISIEFQYHPDFSNTFESSVFRIKNQAFEMKFGIKLY